MRVPARILAAATLAALAGTTSPADAACVGTTGTAYACVIANPGGLPSVNPTGGSITDCVYLGPGPCKPVSVPVPTVTPGSGRVVSTDCGGNLIDELVACS